MTSTSPVFSVIIPTLNEVQNLPKLLKDLVNQTHSDFEVIVVDGKSVDKTLNKAKTFLSLLHLKLLTSNIRNAGYQRNLGAKTATGKFLIFLDADSRIPKYYLQEIDLTQAKIGKNFTLGATWIKSDSKSDLEKIIAQVYNQLLILNRDIAPAAIASSLIIKRNLFKKAGGFNPRLTFAEDRDLIKKLWKSGHKLHILKSPLATWSFRRFRKEGYSKALGKLLYLNIYAMLKGAPQPDKINYPMGGQCHR